MFNARGLFSEAYNEYLKRRDWCRSKALQAQEEVRGYKLLGQTIDVHNPEEVIATLYILYKEKEAFHE